MQHTRTKPVPAHEVEVVEHTTCDLCGENLKSVPFKVDEVDCRCRSGEVFPEGGEMQTREYDICPDCFRTVLEPFLRGRGAGKPRLREWTV